MESHSHPNGQERESFVHKVVRGSSIELKLKVWYTEVEGRYAMKPCPCGSQSDEVYIYKGVKYCSVKCYQRAKREERNEIRIKEVFRR